MEGPPRYDILRVNDGPDDPEARLKAAQHKLYGLVSQWRARFTVPDTETVIATYTLQQQTAVLRSTAAGHIRAEVEDERGTTIMSADDILEQASVLHSYGEGDAEPELLPLPGDLDERAASLLGRYDTLSRLVFDCDDIEIAGR